VHTYQVNPARPRWVVAEPGPAPLSDRLIGYSERLADLDTLIDARRKDGGAYELVEVVGPDTACCPLAGERPRYWESLHRSDEFICEVAAGIEVYRRGPLLLVVDDTGPGSPELLGALPAGLGPRPDDPDESGVAEDDPRWLAMSDADITWLAVVDASSLSAAMSSLGATAGWFLIEALRAGGYDPAGGDVRIWLADRVGRFATS